MLHDEKRQYFDIKINAVSDLVPLWDIYTYYYLSQGRKQ